MSYSRAKRRDKLRKRRSADKNPWQGQKRKLKEAIQCRELDEEQKQAQKEA